jgi:CRISPR-associated protein Cmr6
MLVAKLKSSRRVPLENIRLVELAAQNAKADNKASTVLTANAGLWLDKYITSLDRGEVESHSQLVAEVANLPVPEMYARFYTRWKKVLEEEYHAQVRPFNVKGRMVVGLGSEGVLETSIMLHHTYGVPYIPGSALKGLAASYARLVAGEDWKEESKAYITVFGTSEAAGFITFFDALYIPETGHEKRPLHTDVITVHHPEYYRGTANAAPADWDSPTPIPFLSATGSYLIALAAPDLDNGAAWLNRVFEILTEALTIMGIGAKTSSGYGRMECTDKRYQQKKPTHHQIEPIKLPELEIGQEFMGTVAKEDQRALIQNIVADEEISQILSYRSSQGVVYSLRDIAVVITHEYTDAQHWEAGNLRKCRITRVEKHDRCLIVFCMPAPSKFAGKKKKH